MVREITRSEAEKLFDESAVVSSCVEQNESELRVLLKLTDDDACLVTYNLKNQQKSYFYSHNE